MPIEMPGGVPFTVDTWTSSLNHNNNNKRHHFLTHAHTDHSVGISTHYSYPIYSTHLTKTLLLHHFPQLDESLFVGIKVGQTLVIKDPDGDFSVTAFDANHCPGAVVFLFEGNFGNILHTGDSRLTPECLNSLPEKYISKRGKEPRCRLDYVFLDCTFGKFSLKMPSKHSAVRQVINCIWKHPKAQVVYLSCDLLGQEDILISVSETFGSKIFVDKEKIPEYFHTLTVVAPEILSEDPSCRFHVLEGFPRLRERAKTMIAEAQANSQPEPLIIRPSTQWYVHDEALIYIDGQGKDSKERSSGAVRDPFGVWHICYSMHSSREELEWALQLLSPKGVVSTTPNCRAMELSYVKKNCFRKKLTFDDPIWKLLGINPEDSPSSDVSKNISSGSSPVEVCYQSDVVESQIEITKSLTGEDKVLIMSPPKKKPPVTLFGRARLDVDNFVLTDDFEKTIIQKDYCEEVVVELISENSKETKTAATITCSEPSVEEERNILEKKCDKSIVDYSEASVLRATSAEKVGKSHMSSYSRNESFKGGFSDNFRKMFRTMNVPVPEPLPSLVELMRAHKRARMDYDFSL